MAIPWAQWPKEWKDRYRANRLKRYAEAPKYRAHVLARNKKNRDGVKDEYNASRRERRRNDPEWRAQQNAKRRANPLPREHLRDYLLRRNYGISLARYNEMLREQGGKCGLCAQAPQDDLLCVDHNHATGSVRKLLCRTCNTGLGCFKDDPELFAKAVRYLKEHDGH